LGLTLTSIIPERFSFATFKLFQTGLLAIKKFLMKLKTLFNKKRE